MTNVELRAALMNLNKHMTAQANGVNNHFVVQINQGGRPQSNAGTPASRIRDFMKMNPPTFHDTTTDAYPKGFID